MRVNDTVKSRQEEKGTRSCQFLYTGNDKRRHVMLVFADSDRG